VPVKAEDVEGIVAWAKANNPDLVVVGPEAPLVAGLVDSLNAAGFKAFGPVAAGARMEGSKRFAKEVMKAANVPTGRAETFTDAAKAKEALPRFGLPVVVKADGLAAGKGVVVAETKEEAEAAIDDMLVMNKFGAAGAEVLIEEFLDGEECSILAMTDGETVVLLPGSQDHKRIFDGDKGGDGEIVKFYFKVPEKAKKGTVYPIGIYYMPPTDERSDMFIGTDGDKSREKYAFQNWTGGSITVK
jgi:phosphoribosylamine--glycine ligase